MATKQQVAEIIEVDFRRLKSQASAASRFLNHGLNISERHEDDETSASSDDESGDLASPNPFSNITMKTPENDFNRHSLFSANDKTRKSFFGLQNKLVLTADEKELLDELRKALGLDEKEFALKLQENNIPLKAFVLSLKKDMQRFHIPSPKDFPELFLRKILEEKILPEFLLKKPELQEKLKSIAFENKMHPRLNPFSTRPKPPTLR